MQFDPQNIDDFFRKKFDSIETNSDGAAKDWKQLEHSMDQPGPKKSVRRKITRRIIRYLGVAALVTTVTYFAVSKRDRSGSKTPVTAATQKPATGSTQMPSYKKRQASSVQPGVTIPVLYPIKTKKPSQKNVVQVTHIFSDTTVLARKPVMVENKRNATVMRDFYTRMQTPLQFFTIYPNRDTVLFGDKGTVVRIPARIFRGPDNKLVRSQITIQLGEYYSYHDMLLKGLTTTSNDQQLITGGMIRLEALADERVLTLGDTRGIDIMMPMDNYDPGMQLFMGQQKIEAADTLQGSSDLLATVNWSPAGQMQTYQNTHLYVERKNIKILEYRQVLRGEKEKYNGHFFVKAADQLREEKIKQLLQQKFYNQFDRISIERVKLFENEIRAKNTGAIATKKGFVSGDSLAMDFKKALEDKLISPQDSLVFIRQLEYEWLAYKEKSRLDSLAFIKKKEFDKAYSFNIKDLGWINCDKFYNNRQPRYEFSIKIDDADIDGKSGNYRMVFADQKSVLAGKYINGEISFGFVPEGENVQIVCVAPRKGEAVACVKAIRIGAAEMLKLVFEPVSTDSFKEKLLKL